MTADPFAVAKTDDPFTKFTKLDVVHEGDRLVLPANPEHMSIPHAIRILEEKQAENESFVQIYEKIEALPWDGAVAFFKAMREIFGWGRTVRTPPKSFFDSAEPPTYISVKTGFRETTTILWGSFKIPTINGRLECGVHEEHGKMFFCLKGEVQKSDYEKVYQVVEKARHYALTESIYRSKAIRFDLDSEGQVDFNTEPTFLDLSNVRQDELIFSDEVQTQITTSIFTPIRHSAVCQKIGIPLRRGVLLEGKYGVGKTLTASVTAQICSENGWTFITVPNAMALKAVLEFAKLYQPCVVFCEDIDRVMNGERSLPMDDLLNTIDGVVNKNTQIMTILTTNQVEGIHKSMIRPGRLDAVISVEPPDSAAAQRIIRMYSRGLIEDGEDLSEVGEAVEGNIPAVLREIVERAKLYAVSRVGSSDFVLKATDLLGASHQMKNHLELLAPAPDEQRPPLEEALGNLVTRSVGNALNTAVDENKARKSKGR